MTGANVPTAEERESIIRGLVDHTEGADAYCELFEIVFDYEVVDAGTVIFHPYLEIMRTLALKAPVCHLVKPHVWAAMQQVIDGEPVIGVLPCFCKHSPMLQRLLRSAEGGPAAELIKDLFQEMLSKAKKAFEVDAQVRTARFSFVLLII